MHEQQPAVVTGTDGDSSSHTQAPGKHQHNTGVAAPAGDADYGNTADAHDTRDTHDTIVNQVGDVYKPVDLGYQDTDTPLGVDEPGALPGGTVAGAVDFRAVDPEHLKQEMQHVLTETHPQPAPQEGSHLDAIFGKPDAPVPSNPDDIPVPAVT